MKNASNISKIVVVALLGTLIAHDVILVRMLKEERLNKDLYKEAYHIEINEKCRQHAELMAEIHKLEWRLKEYEGEA